MKYYIISDTHFGHENIHEFGKRPRGFEQLILSNIGNTLTRDDIIIHLGDFAWSSVGDWTNMFMGYTNIAKARYLIMGNHDKFTYQWGLEHRWNVVCDTLSLVVNKKRILFSHKPQQIGDYDFNIHGHFHNVPNERIKLIEPQLFNLLTDKHKLISIEETNYQLVDLQTLIK
jgi:calcineurin-like phosphoesterase family protein